MPPDKDSLPPPVFVTGLRRRDLCVMAAFASVILVTAPWMRVYYRITSFELELTNIEPSGVRRALPLPAELDFSAYWNREPDDLLPLIEQGFRRAFEIGSLAGGVPGVRYEFAVRYSFNSPRRDQRVSWQTP